MGRQSLLAGLDIASVSVLLATIAGWLPSIATLLTILWTLIRLTETETVRQWFRRYSRWLDS